MAYTKYSLTPADNNAAPPNGAPEGMLPSAVNDTMRDMMSQIRDVGDGIRGGTYTMTAPVITGGSISGLSSLASTGVATFSAGSVSAPAITTTGDTNTGIYFPGADTIAFAEGGTEVMRINSAGRVGIGTTDPQAVLDINGDFNLRASTTENRAIEVGYGRTGNGFSYIDLVSDATYTDFGLRIVRGDGGANASSSILSRGTGNFSLSCSESAPIVFITSNTERMRIAANGLVGIGTSSPAYQLEVKNSSIFVGINSDGTNGVIESNGPLFVRTSTANPLIFGTNTAERMRIDSSGRLLLGSSAGPSGASSGVNFYTPAYIACHGYASRSGADGSFTGNLFNIYWTGAAQLWIDTTNIGNIAFTSDYRVKRNVENQTAPALERVMALRPVTYQMADYGDLFKSGEEVKEGFIAHEVQEVIPSGAEGVKDDPNQIQSLRVDAILAVAVKAIQEQQTMIEELKAKVAALEAA